MSAHSFLDNDPAPLDQWRAIVLFGRNVASYKFALAESLLELGAKENEFVALDELARPFSAAVRRHLDLEDKQGTQPTSRFLDACRDANAGRISESQLIGATVQHGFQNVIDAFHRVGGGDVPHRFFLDERKGPRKGIRILPGLITTSRERHALTLREENDARWRLVETAWSLDLPVSAIQVTRDEESEQLFVVDKVRRKSITGVRDGLLGYQRGACFYCRAPISTAAHASTCADVDHFLPWALRDEMHPHSADGVWNLVLACQTCNRGPQGKFDNLPTLECLEDLFLRNEFYIQSHHPLRETLINQTGEKTANRKAFLQARWDACRATRPGPLWKPAEIESRDPL